MIKLPEQNFGISVILFLKGCVTKTGIWNLKIRILSFFYVNKVYKGVIEYQWADHYKSHQ